MLKQIEGSRGIAEAVALCRPSVVCAYPITPQTHIVEALSEFVRTGLLPRCEFINVESEFAALSVAIGACSAGARAYTATSSQGLLFMTEAVYNAAGLSLPIVMTIGNRAIGAPINIWNAHSDAMAIRDAGWIQLFAKDNQEAVDLHIQAYRIAETLSCPVMVCVDGFILTHAFERLEIPTSVEVDAFLPAFAPMQRLDTDEPVTIGAMVGPEAFTEVRYLAHHQQLCALECIPRVAGLFESAFGRAAGGLVRGYRTEDADTVLVAMGSVNGTIEDVVDEQRAAGRKLGCVAITTFRPFPEAAVGEALRGATRVIVVEKNLVPGGRGVLAASVQLALEEPRVTVHSVIAGLGGRPITRAALHRTVNAAAEDRLDDPHFLDLDRSVIERELSRRQVLSGPDPRIEHVLRDPTTLLRKHG